MSIGKRATKQKFAQKERDNGAGLAILQFFGGGKCCQFGALFLIYHQSLSDCFVELQARLPSIVGLNELLISLIENAKINIPVNKAPTLIAGAERRRNRGAPRIAPLTVGTV